MELKESMWGEGGGAQRLGEEATAGSEGEKFRSVRGVLLGKNREIDSATRIGSWEDGAGERTRRRVTAQSLEDQGRW